MSRARPVSSFIRQLLKSAGPVLVPMAILIVFGLPAFLAAWVAIVGLFVISRLSERFGIFADWSWLQFLLTVGCGLAVTYILLLISAGF